MGDGGWLVDGGLTEGGLLVAEALLVTEGSTSTRVWEPLCSSVPTDDRGVESADAVLIKDTESQISTGHVVCR